MVSCSGLLLTLATNGIVFEILSIAIINLRYYRLCCHLSSVYEGHWRS